MLFPIPVQAKGFFRAMSVLFWIKHDNYPIVQNLNTLRSMVII
jgi:hypothetical protein